MIRLPPVRTIALLALLVAASLVAPARAPAQLSPADSAAVLVAAAEEFEAQGRPEIARAIYGLVADRYGATAAGALAAERFQGLPGREVEGSGRVELLVWSTLYGAFLGVAIPGAAGANNAEAYGIGLLAGGPVGFLFGRRVARDRPLTEGQARAITLGGTWGAWQGFGWREVFDLGIEERCDRFNGERVCFDEGDTTEETFAAMIVGSLAGVATGAVLSRRPITPGVATTVNFGALWGTWFGAAGGVLADLENDDLLAAALIGGNAGLLTTALLAPGWNVSQNRARLVSIAGVIGGLVGGGLDLLIQPDDERVAVGIPLATSIAGLAIGIHTTRDYDDPVSGRAFNATPAASLLHLAEGELRVGIPLPVGTQAGGGDRTGRVGITLFDARF